MKHLFFEDLIPDEDQLLHRVTITRQDSSSVDDSGSSFLGTDAASVQVVREDVPCLVEELSEQDSVDWDRNVNVTSYRVSFAKDYGIRFNDLLQWKAKTLRVRTVDDALGQGILFTTRATEYSR